MSSSVPDHEADASVGVPYRIDGEAALRPSGRRVVRADLFDDAAPDSTLIERAMGGHAGAFAELVERYRDRAFWVAYHVVGDVEEARDVTQEAFIRVHRSLHKFDFSRNFYTWFYRIVMNLAIDSLRRSRSSPAVSLGDMGDSLPGLSNTVEPIEVQETRDLVWRVLGKLAPKFRSVLVLRDIHGISCLEIAPILSITHATVRWRLSRSRMIFREHWERMQRGWGDDR